MSSQALQELAKEDSFVRRTSKYGGKDPLSLCVWFSQEVAIAFLSQLCSQLESTTGALVSPKGLNERFNPAAVQFPRDILTQLLGSECIASLRPGDVRICDLGYFPLKDFRAINEKKAFFLSCLKLNTRVYMMNPNPEIFHNG
ncbi:hypothetical protein BEH_26085 (plasmid) [Priestia filamentosa]|uniref:Transposase n=1 Tax=Priestia filamentosa TaxID=1402861 RepID=A0A2S1M0D5_9BACI|nr:hypothetical protein BEH_26085 [Priestia filamentosa]